MSPVTMQDIAKRAGVTNATVSMALRNHSRISRATCRRIQRLAAEMGYRPNPMVTSLMTEIRARRPAAGGTARIAYLQLFPKELIAKLPAARRYRAGAAARAAQLGFCLEEFWMQDEQITPRRLSDILYHRNITGVLIPTLPQPGHLADLPWERISAATMGYTLLEPRVHRAMNHQMHSIRLALSRLTERGYRRLGLALSKAEDRRVEGNWRAGFYLYQQDLAAHDRVPVFIGADWGRESQGAYNRWLKENRPEVVIAARNEEPRDWIRQAGLRVPDDIGFCTLTSSNACEELSGVDQNDETVGGVAIELVAEQLHHNERGIPPDPKVVLVEGRWHEGKTLFPAREA
jgi:LacI family transcriptional regulator